MKNLFFKTIINIGSYFIEDSIPSEKVQMYLNNQIKQLINFLENSDSKQLTDDVMINVYHIKNICESSNILQDEFSWPDLPDSVEETDRSGFNSWFNSLYEKKVLLKGVVTRYSGSYLNYILSTNREEFYEFIENNIEALMRHIEIKRKDSLLKFDQELSKEDIWIERHDIAILMARYARTYKELRVLNTLLKLNDWAYPYHQKFNGRICQLKYINALCEQEKSTKELLR